MEPPFDTPDDDSSVTATVMSPAVSWLFSTEAGTRPVPCQIVAAPRSSSGIVISSSSGPSGGGPAGTRLATCSAENAAASLPAAS